MARRRRPVRSPACPLCSKPIESGTLVLYEEGELLHVHCRSRTAGVAMDEVARADAAQERAARLVEAAARALRARRKSPRREPCPVCEELATVLDWRPSSDWLSVEDCACGGFLVWSPLVEPRLRALSAEARGTLCLRIREHRASGAEAWLTTEDGALSGTLVVRSDRPARA